MIKIASQFSGIGSFEQAITNLGIEHENIMAVDFDKYARQTYTANFGEPKHYFVDSYNADYENVENVDVFLSSPPCQSFSLAGKRLGESDPRGLLFFETLRFINCNKPKYFIIENVKGLLSMDDGEVFRNWIQLLGQSENGNTFMFPHEDSLMYNLHWQVLNTKDYGLPQNRERVFLIGIRNDLPNDFNFPKTIPLKLRLKDILEDIVDEKYYLSEKTISYITKREGVYTDFNPEISRTICAQYAQSSNGSFIKSDNIIQVGNVNPSGNGMNGNVFSENGISPTLTTNKGEGIKIQIASATKSGYEIATEGDSGIIQLNNPKHSNDRIYSDEGLSPTLNTMQGGNRQPFISVENNLFNTEEIRIFTRNNKDGKILLELLEEIGICEIEEWLFGITKSIEAEEILQSEVYVGSIHEKEKEATKGYINPLQQSKSTKIITKFIMRGLQSKEWYRCSPQRRKSTKQFIRKFTETMSVLPYKETQSREWLQSSELQRKTQGTWFLREALSEIQKIRKSTSNESERQFRIRKLTPLEAFRLQGFPDDFKKPVSNSQLYKQAGNTISVNVIQAILKNLLK